jgi:hypothetical protein
VKRQGVNRMPHPSNPQVGSGYPSETKPRWIPEETCRE